MTDASRPEAVRTFRAASGPVSLVLSSLLALFLLGDAVVRAGWAQGMLLAPWVLLGLWVVYVVAFVSSVRIDDDGVVVQNLLRRTSFGWDRVRDIDLKWQLVFSLDDGSDVTCYGGPARGRPLRRATGDEEATAPTSLRDLTAIRDRWESTPTPAPAESPIRRGWDGPALIALAIIAAWAVASILIAGA